MSKNLIFKNDSEIIDLIKQIKPDINFFNEYYINTLIDTIKSTKLLSKKKIKRIIRNYIGLAKNKSTIFSKQYWISLGWNEILALEKVKSLQTSNSNKRHLKYTKDEISKQSIWSKAYWKDSDNPNGYKQFNSSSREFYKSDIEYAEKKIKLSENTKYNHSIGIHRNSYGCISKSEINFFKILCELNNNIKHKSIRIDVRDSNLSKHKFRIPDGYIEVDNKIIIIEYDGHVWHNEIDDEIRTSEILECNNNIIGFIRFGHIYASKNKNNKKELIKNINDGITKIKNKECKTVKYY